MSANLFQPIVEFDALKHDVNALFLKFCEKQSVRFDDFAEAWRELNFNCLFACTERNTEFAKMRVAERLFRIASEFLSPEATFLYRVAAVYCLYAVYFKQIADVKVKIRMTPTMWVDLMEFLEVVQAHQHLDVAYVILKLKRSKAFVFTAMPKHLSFGKKEFMLACDGNTEQKRFPETDKYVEELLQGGHLMEGLSKIQSEYEEVRKKLLMESKEDEITDLKKNLCVSHSDFNGELKNLLESYSTKHRLVLQFKPPDLSSSQRPVLSLPIYQGERVGQENVVEQPRIKENKEGKTRAARIAKIKTESFANAAGSSIADADDPDNQPRAYYRRSAMVEEYMQRGWKRQSHRKSSMKPLKPLPRSVEKRDSDIESIGGT